MAGKWDNEELYQSTLTEGKRLKLMVTGMLSNGEPRIDIRNYFLNDDDEWAPSSKGVRIHAEMAPDLREKIKEALDAVDEKVSVKGKKTRKKK